MNVLMLLSQERVSRRGSILLLQGQVWLPFVSLSLSFGMVQLEGPHQTLAA